MEQHFYLGALELIYKWEQTLSLQQFDSCFLTPVLPVKQHVAVDIEWVDNLPAPPRSATDFEIPDALIWIENGTEQRFYRNIEGTPYIASFLLPDGRIRILMRKDYHEKIVLNYRPWFQIHLERLLLRNQALILHSASIIYRGEAILFSAPSGTGKTTQTDLWHTYCEGVSDLNGDRTLLQLTENGWFACGYPIYGSMLRCTQAAVPIRAIVILHQDKTDTIRELSPIEKLVDLYSECTIMRDYPEDVEKAMGLLENLVANVTVTELGCTMERSAADTLHEYLYGE